jgi:hypothetical protein
VILRETYQVDSLELTMAAAPSIDPAQFLHEQLASASPDLLHPRPASEARADLAAENRPGSLSRRRHTAAIADQMASAITTTGVLRAEISSRPSRGSWLGPDAANNKDATMKSRPTDGHSPETGSRTFGMVGQGPWEGR